MKILAYDDNSDYGGHQIMAVHGIEALNESPSVEVTCMTNPANYRLAEKLKGFRVTEAPCALEQLKALKPDLMLCIQGDIRQSTQGIKVAKQAGIECISYLALPHTLAAMGAKLGALRDRLDRKLPNSPDRYIVLSESMKKILVGRGGNKPIDIVPNGIRLPTPSTRNPQPANLTLGLLGRIEFKQKQQDFMVRAFSGNPEAFGNCRLLIAGDGPDRERLRAMVEGKESITLLPWQDDPGSFYGQIDFLIIPSRFEGMPLVMLEALARGIPVIGSRCDGMRDLLPVEWTFEPGNAADLANTFSMARESTTREIEAIQEKIRSGMSLEIFKRRFCDAVLKPKS